MSELLNIYKTLKNKKWVNLSHKIDENSPKFPALPALEKENVFTLKMDFMFKNSQLLGNMEHTSMHQFTLLKVDVG